MWIISEGRSKLKGIRYNLKLVYKRKAVETFRYTINT